MGNFVIFGIHGKSRFFFWGGAGEGHEKPIYRGDCLKRRGFADLRRDLARKSGVVF